MNRIVCALCFLALAAPAIAQNDGSATNQLSPAAHPSRGHAVIPLVSIPRPGDEGKFMHTNYRIFVPAGPNARELGVSSDTPDASTTPLPGYYYETPASLACLYGSSKPANGCNPGLATKNATGGSKTIAIVDAYDYPTAFGDLEAYSLQFGLPAPTSSTFHVVYAGGANPGPDPACGILGGWNCWASESSLDIEMAHAMAPRATIYLVEANSNSFADLFQAVQVAANLVVCGKTACPAGGKGAGEVSMSWGGGEGSGETAADALLNVDNVVFFASSGDSWGVEYPAASPNVVAVGGTTISRSLGDSTFLDFQAEITWEDGGGGVSQFESQPAYQRHVPALQGVAGRAIPDVAADANPNTGVWVYNSFDTDDIGDDCIQDGGNWCIFGGTSVASPLTAALVNRAGHFASSSAAELKTVYANGGDSSDFRPITYGTCGLYQGWFATPGWDPCTGNGAPVGTGGK